MLGLGFPLSLGQNVAAVSGGGGGSTATWDTVNSSASAWAYTNGNLTANRLFVNFWDWLVATTAKVSGTVQVTVNAYDNGTAQVGFSTVTTTPGTYLGMDAGQTTIAYMQDGFIKFGGGNVLTGATFGAGDVIKAVKTATTVAFYKNNVLQGTVTVTGTPMAGAAYPAVMGGSMAGTQLQVTGDFTSW